MRIIHLTIIPLIAVSPLAQASEIIRQTQLTSGVTWDYHPSSKKGKVWSPIPIDQGGSLFSLYSSTGQATPSQIQKLDESTMGSAFPRIEISTQSDDPHQPTRTRADQAFKVTVKQNGPQRKPISIQHTRLKYNPTTHSHTPGTSGKQSWFQLPVKPTQHGTFHPTIPSEDARLAEGEETFTAYSTGPTGKQLHPLKSTSIQVWPVASVNISGITAHQTYKSTAKLQNVSVQCHDLYPDSITYVQIYRGEQRLGTLGRILPQTVIRFDTKVPQDQKIPLGDWSKTLRDGPYTLEVLHITPFNQRKPERLAHISFVIDRGMHASGLVSNQP